MNRKKIESGLGAESWSMYELRRDVKKKEKIISEMSWAIMGLRRDRMVAIEALKNISLCYHIPGGCYIAPSCICHRKFADAALKELEKRRQ